MRDSENTEFERLAVYTSIVTDNAKLKQLIIEITVGGRATKRLSYTTILVSYCMISTKVQLE